MNRFDLINYRSNIERSKKMREHLEELNEELYNINSKLSDMPGARSNIQDKLAEKICDLQDKINKYIEEQIDLVDRNTKVLTALNKMTGLNRVILEMKYIEGKKLVEIAYLKSYNYDYIRQKHGIALCIFDNISKKGS